jgi:hypothetical protein
MYKAPFVVQQQLTAIALAYRNSQLIADSVLPRFPVLSQQFKYTLFAMADTFTIPDTRVGRKSGVNEIDWSASEQTASVSDYGLEDAVPQADIEQAKSVAQVTGVNVVDPLSRSTEILTDLIALAREVRVANLIFNANSYAAANKATLAGTSQWSDFANSDPIGATLAAFDTMVMRPNVAIFGRQVWTKLSQHPKVIAAAYPLGGNAASGGKVASRQAVADLLEVNQILVGEGWLNTAKKGQAPSMARVWGKHAAFLYQNPVPTGPLGGITFGYTAEWGTRIAGVVENDPDIGLRGGTRVRVGESLVELVAANDVGYFFQNAVA